MNVGSEAAFTITIHRQEELRFRAGHYPVTNDGINGLALTFPIQVLPGSAPLWLGGRRGSFQLGMDGDMLQAVNALPLEQYVADVVSVENPAYWPQEALRSQAIASRSYALANLRPSAKFDLYADNRSQNYVGLRKEYPSAVEATAATKGEVLRYQGQIIDAFFTAANGGKTSNTEGIWGGPPLPYLAVHADPFDARSPDTSWGPIQISLPALRQASAAAADCSRPRRRRHQQRRQSEHGHVRLQRRVELHDRRNSFQQRLGLRSTYIELAASYSQ